MREIFKRNQSGAIHSKDCLEDALVSNIEIVLDASKYKDEYSWLFSVFVKYDGLDDSSSLYEEFLETKESLIISIEYENKAKYLGSRMIDGWSEFYFCASSAKELDSMVTAMLKDTGYAYESNIVKDKKWGFYETQLFPTELELVHLQSDKIIFLLEEEGEDLSIARDVEHYISFDTPTQKNRFLNTLEIDGFSFKDEISSDEFENGVALVKKHCVSEEEVIKVVEELFAKVKEDGGYYEGWSTTLVNSEQVEE